MQCMYLEDSSWWPLREKDFFEVHINYEAKQQKSNGKE